MPKYIISDGRQFTDYTPSCILNHNLQHKYNIKNSHDFRSFLQKNSTKVMNALAVCDSEQSCSVCPVCKHSL